MSELVPNNSLNLNSAREDKFFLRFGNIPSAKLLTPTELGAIEKILLHGDDKEFFHLALSTANIPEVSLGELRYDNRFASITDTDMKIKYGEFTTSITLDDNYLIYRMLILWIFMIKNPEGYNQFYKSITYEETVVTALLLVNDNFDNTVLTFEFFDLRPLRIPSINLTYVTEGAPLKVDITWSYSYFMPRTSDGKSISFQI